MIDKTWSILERMQGSSWLQMSSQKDLSISAQLGLRLSQLEKSNGPSRKFLIGKYAELEKSSHLSFNHTMSKTIQIRKKCEHCLIESSRIEVHDSAGTEGVAMYSECSFCRCQYENGVRIRGPIQLDTTEQVQAAFAVWMRAEGYSNPIEFCRAHFQVSSPAEFTEKVLAREDIDTNFDVLGYLFSGMAGQAEPEQAVVSSDEHEPYLDFDIYYS